MLPAGKDMAEQGHKPGAEVQQAGVYLVLHRRHRPPHDATLVEGQKFPECAECGAAVRFRLLRAATPIERDKDFRKRRSAHAAG
jgi:hypothetical protein